MQLIAHVRILEMEQNLLSSLSRVLLDVSRNKTTKVGIKIMTVECLVVVW